ALPDGKFLEVRGHYYPRTKAAQVELDGAGVGYLLSRGSEASETARALIKIHLPAGSAEPPAAHSCASPSRRAARCSPGRTSTRPRRCASARRRIAARRSWS